MAVTVQGTPTVYEGASVTSVVLPYPTGVQAGELLIAAVTHSDPIAPSVAPSGWTLLRAQNNTAPHPPSTSIFYKWAVGNEVGDVTWSTSTTAGKTSGIMIRFAGVHTTSPFDSGSTDGAASTPATTFTVPGIGTSSAYAVVVYDVALNASSTSDINTPSGLTRVASTTTIGRDMTVFMKEVPTASAIASQTFTHVAGTQLQWAGIVFVLRSATDSGGGTPPPPTTTDPTAPPAGTSPTLVSRAVGIHDDPSTNARVQVKVQNAVSVRLKCSTDSAGLQGVVYGTSVAPSSRGDARLVVTGLQPNTRYYYRVLMTNSSNGEWPDASGTIGRFKTAPAGPASFSFNFSSCNSGYATGVFTSIVNRGDDMFFHLGDLYYADGSGTGLDNFRSKMGNAITSAQNMWATTNSMYIPSDHDGMNNNVTAGSDGTAWNNWNIARSELMPNPQSYFTHSWGPRVRFIHLDTRSFCMNPGAADNSSKTKLGATQKAWLKSTIQNATEPIIIISQDAPFVISTDVGDDGWGGFITERNELATFFGQQQTSNGKKIVILGGDMHALAVNNGSSSPGNTINLQAAPINNTVSNKGGPWTAGPYPGSGSAQQYGRVTITDTGGTSIGLTFKGYTINPDTERMSYTTTFTVPAYQETIPGNQIQLRRAEVFATPPATISVKLHRAAVSVPSGGNAAVKIHRAEVAVVGAADPGVNIRNLSPGLTVTMTAVAPGTPTNYTWDQIAGPTVTKTVSADTTQCTYVTPALKADATLAFRVVANYPGGTKSGEGITRHEVVRTAHLYAGGDGSTSTVTFRPIEIGVPTDGGEEEPGSTGGGTTNPPNEEPPPPPGYQPVGGPANTTWTLKLAEDFNELNRSLWTPYLRAEGGINNTSGTYARNVTVENGECSLKLESSSAGAAISSNPNDGVAGHTGFEFVHGYVEARIFFPGNGTQAFNWPVFLTQGQTLSADGEEDIAEAAGWAGANNMLNAFYHWDVGFGDQSQGIQLPGSLTNGWHVFALHRKADGFNDHYVDGQLVYSYRRAESAPHYIAIINEAARSTTNQVYGDTAKVKVDYVRAWQIAGTTDPGGGDPGGGGTPGGGTGTPTGNTVRFVSNSGDDTNPGTEAAPWASLNRVRSAISSGELKRGDAVALKRGDTWYGSFSMPAVQGTSGVLTFGAYGTGARPQMLGYKVSNNSWVQHATNVWRLNITANSGAYTGNTSQASTNVGFLRLPDGSIKGWKKLNGTNELVNDWDFYNDSTNVYVRLATNPGAGIRIAVQCNGFDVSSNTKVTGIYFSGYGAHGITNGGGYTNVQITDNYIEYVGGSLLRTTDRYGNGVELWIGASDTTVEGNTIRETYDVAVTMQGPIETRGNSWRNCHVRNNRIENCNQTLELWSSGTSASGTGYIGCSFTDNICLYAGYSWAALIRADQSGMGTHFLSYLMDLPCDFEIARNTFYRARNNYARCSTGSMKPQAHDNKIYLEAGQKILYQTSETIEQYAAYQSRTGNEINSQFFVVAPGSVYPG